MLVLRTLKFISPFIYFSSLPASSLQCDLSNLKQRLSILSLYSYQKMGLELSSGPTSPLSSILEEALECCQLCDQRNQAASLIKGTRTMVSLSSMLSSPCHQIDRYSWELAQQNGMGWLCLVSCFQKLQHFPSNQHKY